MDRRRLLILSGSLCINAIFSLVVLPFAIPPFTGYSPWHLLDVLFWQLTAALGWPLVILGGFLALLIPQLSAHLSPIFLALVYPIMLILLVRGVFSRRFNRWEFILLHFLFAASFVSIWYQVLNGYDFMVG